jgi:hypothetical protein
MSARPLTGLTDDEQQFAEVAYEIAAGPLG